MRQLEKCEVIGRRIVDIIVSLPDRPVTMSDQSYSNGFLRLDSGYLINLGSDAPLACDESEVRDLIRDKETEREFGPAIGQEIVGVILPEERDDWDIRITTANGFVISFALGLFWIRPIIEPVDKRTRVSAVKDAVLTQCRAWWKFW